MIDLVFNNGTANKTWKASFFNNILQKASGNKEVKMKKRVNYGVSISLVGESRMRSLNKTYRSKDSSADVLSFPMAKGRSAGYSGEYGIIDVGDIFICLQSAKKKAESQNIPLKEHLAFLTVHGFLHLLGFDHKNPAETKKMFAVQSKILNKFKFSSSR